MATAFSSVFRKGSKPSTAVPAAVKYDTFTNELTMPAATTTTRTAAPGTTDRACPPHTTSLFHSLATRFKSRSLSSAPVSTTTTPPCSEITSVSPSSASSTNASSVSSSSQVANAHRELLDPSSSPSTSPSLCRTQLSKDKLRECQQQVDEAIGVMKNNIEKAVERDASLVVLEGEVEELKAKASMFERAGRKLKHKMWWKNAKFTVILTTVAGVIVLVVVLVIVL